MGTKRQACCPLPHETDAISGNAMPREQIIARISVMALLERKAFGAGAVSGKAQ
jgi:hypothetical protein